MTCANCGASARLDRERGVFVCDYCGGEFVPAAGEDGVQVRVDTMCKCPVCDGMLSEAKLEFHLLLYCTRCHGMLVAIDEFVPLIGALRSYRYQPSMAVPPQHAQGERLPRICPRCSQAMDNHSYGGPGNVVIDTCERCSLNWLDKGELQKIASSTDRTFYESLFSASGDPRERS
jgi:Zn-finger nucleic acid-binding protein